MSNSDVKVDPTIKEVVLPSGVFFRMRHMNLYDFLVVGRPEHEELIPAIAAQCGTFDDERRTMQQIKDMDLADGLAVARVVQAEISRIATILERK